MAKKKHKIETVIIPANETPEEVELVKEEIIEPIKNDPVKSEDEIETVLGLSQAEQMQKSGWQLIDCHQTSKGKEYKFRKVK